MAEKQGISLREYARRKGVSHTAVEKAISSGRLATLPDGSINPEAAGRQWAENSRAAAGNMKELKLQHEVALLNQKVKQASGRYIPKEDVRNLVSAVFSDLREHLINRCHRLAPSLANQRDISKIARLLEEDTKQTIAEYRNAFRERILASNGRNDMEEGDI